MKVMPLVEVTFATAKHLFDNAEQCAVCIDEVASFGC
jgi:hypothetical protein